MNWIPVWALDFEFCAVHGGMISHYSESGDARGIFRVIFPMAVELSYQSMVLTPPTLGQPGKRAFYKLRVKNGILRYEYVETR